MHLSNELWIPIKNII